tara:strand:+ start:24 stop:488 length:465 start_codon:yes stop_codon:yes gene_type:complete
MKYTEVKVGDYATAKYAVIVPVIRSKQSDICMFTHPSHWGTVDSDTQLQSHLWRSGHLDKDVIVQCVAKLGTERTTLWKVIDGTLGGKYFVVNLQFRDFNRTHEPSEKYPGYRKCVRINPSPYTDHSPFIKQRMTDEFMRRLGCEAQQKESENG